MKKLILVVFYYVLIAAGTQAQTASDNIIIEQVTPAGGESNTFRNADLLDQYAGITGITNLQQRAAEASQLGYIQMRGHSNRAHILQSGTVNIGAITISGAFNESTLNQTGSNLLSLIHIEGRSNQLEVNQRGDNLGNFIQVLGSRLDVEISQGQTGFRYRQGGSANPVIITSTARNVPLIIRNN